jgi:hypothetical protein
MHKRTILRRFAGEQAISIEVVIKTMSAVVVCKVQVV